MIDDELLAAELKEYERGYKNGYALGEASRHSTGPSLLDDLILIVCIYVTIFTIALLISMGWHTGKVGF